MQEYKTIERQAEDFFTEKKSRFIGHVKPVTTQEEAMAFIQSVKSQHWDAKHNVYAYVLRRDNLQRYSDDGEPSGTAGLPMLEVILKNGVVDVCVVATRYFGGILLGTGGLVRAYAHTAKIALAAGTIITMAPCSVLQTEVAYGFYEKLQKLLNNYAANILDTVYADTVCITFSVQASLQAALQAELTDISSGSYTLRFIETRFDKTLKDET